MPQDVVTHKRTFSLYLPCRLPASRSVFDTELGSGQRARISAMKQTETPFFFYTAFTDYSSIYDWAMCDFHSYIGGGHPYCILSVVEVYFWTS
jgi:hypothetical protein